MRDAERWWVLVAGVAGLVAFTGGSLLTGVPRVDDTLERVQDDVARRRNAVLVGSVLSVSGPALLLWPLAVIATSDVEDVWPSLALFSIGAWVLGFAVLAFATMLVVAVAWRGPSGVAPSAVRLLLDASHLATWSVSAPLGAISVAATTTVGVQAGLVGWPVVAAAAAKVATVTVEVAGIGRREGWNAGGWAAGVSGHATVAWFALVLAALGVTSDGRGRRGSLPATFSGDAPHHAADHQPVTAAADDQRPVRRPQDAGELGPGAGPDQRPIVAVGGDLDVEPVAREPVPAAQRQQLGPPGDVDLEALHRRARFGLGSPRAGCAGRLEAERVRQPGAVGTAERRTHHPEHRSPGGVDVGVDRDLVDIDVGQTFHMK